MGFPDGIAGPMLINKGIIQCMKFGVRFVKEEVVSAQQDKQFMIKTNMGKQFNARAMIIAAGTPIKLSVVNEDKLMGRGVHYCVNCDGPLYKGKKVAVIGNGDHAAETAMEALSYTKDITIIANSNRFEFSDAYHNELTKCQIKTILSKVREFKAGNTLESIVMEDGTELRFSGVFMASGVAGALDFAANLGLEIQNNMLVVDADNKTNLAGVFAAGNCAGKCRQIAKNAGDGCNAGLSAIKYLRSTETYTDYAHHTEGITITKDAVRIEPIKKEIIKDEIIEERKVEPLFEEPVTKPRVIGKKLRIGWFSFSCCEDSTIVFTEILNDYYDKMKDVIDIRHARVLKSRNDMTDLDVAFVEGAISNPKHEEEVRKIRANCKKLVAVGSCACTGMPSGQRNEFDENRKREIDPIVKAFSYNTKVKPLREVVQVDDQVPGCPMMEASFLAVLNKTLKEFGIDAQL
jgi:thioredoxin reductase (NADPH)